MKPPASWSVFSDGATYDESTIAMQPGDILAAFSDGVTEPERESLEFGEQRLIELVQGHRHQPLSRIGDVITESVAGWIGGADGSAVAPLPKPRGTLTGPTSSSVKQLCK